MKRKTTLFIVQAAIIAAMYATLTILQNVLLPGSASMAVQFRVSEVLTILALFTPAAIPGLTLGCLISNLVTGCALPDIIFGSLATFIGAIGSYALRKNRYLCSVPPVISNALIIPFILTYAYHIPGGIPFFMLTVGLGEVISCMVLGQILLTVLNPIRHRIFPTEEDLT